ncbi:MAG: enoyl-CoA hydratase/isomerase family protein [Actinobacteria bacterium]|nr:enoyl-CoA hydratase/isomerase family protein [Actinomycetota bacterium]
MTIVDFSAVDGDVAWIRISRPDRRNALNQRGVDELHEAVRRAGEAECRALVVTGDADHFCAGADLTELEDPAFTRSLRVVLDDLAAVPFPTIAAISGACMGLGTQIALSCDLRLATADARFAVPVAKLGLMVDHWTLERLAMLAGHSTARWMLLTAAPVTAAEAHRVGLVHRIVDADASPGAAVQAAAGELAAGIARLAPLSLSGSKLGLDLLQRPADALDVAGRYSEAFAAAWASDDLVEGRRAFGERRAPEFRGT